MREDLREAGEAGTSDGFYHVTDIRQYPNLELGPILLHFRAEMKSWAQRHLTPMTMPVLLYEKV